MQYLKELLEQIERDTVYTDSASITISATEGFPALVVVTREKDTYIYGSSPDNTRLNLLHMQ